MLRHVLPNKLMHGHVHVSWHLVMAPNWFIHTCTNLSLIPKYEILAPYQSQNTGVPTLYIYGFGYIYM